MNLYEDIDDRTLDDIATEPSEKICMMTGRSVNEHADRYSRRQLQSTIHKANV